MKNSTSETRIERTYHVNGQLASEVTYVCEQVCGITRYWHENGVLKKEVPVAAGKINGTVRQWNNHGDLLGESMLFDGTGVYKEWYEDGHLMSEVTMKQGLPHGRLRRLDENGILLVEQFFINGKPSTKRKYELENASIAEHNVPMPVVGMMGSSGDSVGEVSSVSERVHEDVVDALTWLRGSSEHCQRTLGELSSTEESIEFICRYLSNGARKVMAMHINVDDDGSENTGWLLIELPSEPKTRKRVLDLCNEQKQLLGLMRVKDTGQQFIQIALD